VRAKYLSYGNRREPKEISDVLGALIERASVQIDVRQGELIDQWSTVAPGDWPDAARPIGIKEKVLLVEVENGTAGSLLKYQKIQLIEAIGDVFGEDLVVDVRLRVSR